MAQKPPLPRRPALLKRYSESSLLHPSSLPRHVDHEEIVKLLGDIPSRQNLFNTSSTEGSSEAPNKYTRRFSELDYEKGASEAPHTRSYTRHFNEIDYETEIPSLHSVMSLVSRSEDDVSCSHYRRMYDYDSPQIDHSKGHRSAPHGHTPRHGSGAQLVPPEQVRRVPRRALTYHGVPKTHSKRFVRIREARDKEETKPDKKDSDADNKDNTTVHIPGEDEAVPYPPSGKDRTEETKAKEDKTETDSIGSRGSSKAIKSGNGSIRRYRRSHRRKPKILGDLPYHCEKQEDEAHLTKREGGRGRSSQFSSMDDDEDTENLDQYAINQMLSHRYDDLAGVRRGSRTLHISRSPATPTRSLSASIQKRSHKPHQEDIESQQQEADIPLEQECIDMSGPGDMDIPREKSETGSEHEQLLDMNNVNDDDTGDERRIREADMMMSNQNIHQSNEEDSDDPIPPTKFARLADADGRQKYFARQKSNEVDDEEVDEEDEEDETQPMLAKEMSVESKEKKPESLNVVHSSDEGNKKEDAWSLEEGPTSASPPTHEASKCSWMIATSDTEDPKQSAEASKQNGAPQSSWMIVTSDGEEPDHTSGENTQLDVPKTSGMIETSDNEDPKQVCGENQQNAPKSRMMIMTSDNEDPAQVSVNASKQQTPKSRWMGVNSDNEEPKQRSKDISEQENPKIDIDNTSDEDNMPIRSTSSAQAKGGRRKSKEGKRRKSKEGRKEEVGGLKKDINRGHDSDDENEFMDLGPEEMRMILKKVREDQKTRMRTRTASTASNSSWDIQTSSDESDSDDDDLPRPKFGTFGQHDVDMMTQNQAKFKAYKNQQRRVHSATVPSGSEKTEEVAADSMNERKHALTISDINPTSALAFGMTDIALGASQKAKLEAGQGQRDSGGDGGRDRSGTGGSIKRGSGGGDKNRKRRVTFGDGWDSAEHKSKQNVTVSVSHDNDSKDDDKPSLPRRRRRGIMLDEGVDHSMLKDMMSEMGDFGEKYHSSSPGGNAAMLKKAMESGVNPKPDPISDRRQQRASNSYNYTPLRQDAALDEDGNDPPRSRKTSYANFDRVQVHPQLFVQLNELDRDDLGGQQSAILSKGASWKSRARWIKFEENWEEGANRWSKPHVASLTFNSLPQLRRGLENGLIMLDVMETSLPAIFNLLVDGLVRMELIEPEHQGSILRMLHLCGTGNKKPREQWRGSVSAVRRLSMITDMARHNSTDNNIPPNSPSSKSLQGFTMDSSNCSNNAIYSVDEVHVSMLDNHDHDVISQNNNNSQPQHVGAGVHREGIMRKIPEDAEGAMVMVAMEDSLNGPVAALVRLVNPPVFDNFIEAPIPLRFIFFLVGPDYSNVDYHEVGRAMSTLFSDDIFRDMAYAALDKQDLLNGINEFLNDTMVLPPGDWDRDLLLPITRHQKREQEKVMQRRKTISPLQMEKDAEAILKMSQDALNYADPLQRTGRIFGGLVNDVKRRFPHYKSDFTDALNFQCVAAFVFIYFACLSPAITFGGLLGEKTDNWMGVSEMIVSTSLCGMLFALLSGQPLVMLGGTGPVLIFEEYLYKFCKEDEIDIDFMAFRTWIGFWICVLATIVVMFEGSVLVRYFTRFTEEIFSTLISIIFIYEVYKGLKHIVCTNPLLPNYCLEEVLTVTTIINVSQWTSSTTESSFYAADYQKDAAAGHGGTYGGAYQDTMQNDPYNCNVTQETYMQKPDYECSPGDKIPQPNTALFAIILTFGTFFISFFLRIFRSSRFLGRTARRALSNFGIAIAILIMVTLAYCLGHIYTHTIRITDGFHPTDPCKRGWLINPMGQKKRLPLGAVFGAIVPAFLVFILLYMETLLIGMVVNKECNKLRKGSGYHLDIFLIGVLSAIAGLLGVPWMCAAPIRTVSHIGSLSVLTRTHAPGVKPKLDHIKDQRVTNFAVSFLIGLSNLLAPLLREVPIAVLLGVFLYLGVISLSGLQFIERLKIFFMPRKHHPDVRYIRMVKVWKMHMFTIIQVICVMVLWVIKNSIIAMAFPFFLILLIFIRKLLQYIFSEGELEALDSEEEDEDDDRQVYEYDLG